MIDALWPVQQAIYDKTTADAGLTALATIYDHVPEAATGDYITFGEFTEVPDSRSAHDREAWDVTATLHIWTRARGYQRGSKILAELDRVLHRQPLDVEGFHVVSVTHEMHQAMRDPDPEIRHHPVRYRIRLEEVKEEEVP